MELNDIIIPKEFIETPPKKWKLKRAEQEYLSQFEFKGIVVDENNILVDGYTRYLVAKKYGIKNVRVTIRVDLNEKQFKRYKKKIVGGNLYNLLFKHKKVGV